MKLNKKYIIVALVDGKLRTIVTMVKPKRWSKIMNKHCHTKLLSWNKISQGLFEYLHIKLNGV